jgi:hypothetical protein
MVANLSTAASLGLSFKRTTTHTNCRVKRHLITTETDSTVHPQNSNLTQRFVRSR